MPAQRARAIQRECSAAANQLNVDRRGRGSGHAPRLIRQFLDVAIQQRHSILHTESVVRGVDGVGRAQCTGAHRQLQHTAR